MSASQIGFIQSAGNFILLTAPTLGLLGDKLHSPKVVWILCLLGQTAFGLLIGFALSPSEKLRQMYVFCDCNGTNLSLFDINGSLPFNCDAYQSWEGEWIKFAKLISLVLAMQAMIGPVTGIADAFVLDILGDDRQKDYGKQRAWGATGWGLSAVGIGFLTDLLSTCADVNYDIHFYLFGGLLGLAVMFAIFVQPRTKISQDEIKLIQSLKMLLSQADVVVFLLGMFLIGGFMAIVDNFLFLFLEDIGGRRTVMGLSLLTMCIGEVLIFIPSGWLIKTLGYHGVVFASLLVFTIRFVAYSFLTDPWFVLVIEPLHGVTFGLSQAASASYMRAMTSADMRAGAQTIAFGIKSGLGNGIGNIIAGVVWNHYGGVWTFRGAAAATAIGGALFWIMHLLVVYRPCQSRELTELKMEALLDQDRMEIKDDLEIVSERL
jgi:MFS family permease